MKTTTCAAIALSLTLGAAANVSISVAQSNSGAEGTSAINLTTDGTEDWGIWQNTNRTLTNSMNGGAGFTSFTLISTATDEGATYSTPENGYSWTNGTPTTTGSNVTNAARAKLGSNGWFRNSSPICWDANSELPGASVYPDYSGQSFLNRHEAIYGTSSFNRATNAPTYLGTLKNQGNTTDSAIIYCGGNDILPLTL